MNTLTTAPEMLEVPICSLDEIPLGLGRAFVIHGRSIAVFRTRDGHVRAVENRCPHRGAPLADGMIAGDSVVCPFHAFRFNLKNGECQESHACSIEAYSARVDGDRVLLTLNAGDVSILLSA